MTGPDPAAVAGTRPGVAGSLGYAVGGQLGYVLAQMAVLAALARFKGVAEVGAFGLALAITTPLFMLASMGSRLSQASDPAGRHALADYAGLVALGAGLAAAAALAIGYGLTGGGAGFAIVAVVAASKMFEAVSTLSYGAFQQAGRIDKVATSLLLRGWLTVLGLVTLLALGAATPVALLAQLGVWGLLALGFDYPRACRISAGRLVPPRWRRDRLRRLLRDTAPIGGGHFMNALLVSLPRLAVDRLLGLEALGLFSVVGYLQQAATLLVNAASQALVNHVARLRQGGSERRLRRVLLRLLGAALAVSGVGLLVVALFGEALLGLLFGPEFRAAAPLLMLIGLAVCAKLLGVVPQCLIYADRRFVAVFWYQAASLVVCVALLALWLPRWGLIGAGAAVLGVALFRLAVLSASALRRRTAAPTHETA